MSDDVTAAGPAEPRRLPRDYPPFLYIPCVSHVTDGRYAEAVYRQTKDGAHGRADRLGQHFVDIINNGPERLERETAR